MKKVKVFKDQDGTLLDKCDVVDIELAKKSLVGNPLANKK